MFIIIAICIYLETHCDAAQNLYKPLASCRFRHGYILVSNRVRLETAIKRHTSEPSETMNYWPVEHRQNLCVFCSHCKFIFNSSHGRRPHEYNLVDVIWCFYVLHCYLRLFKHISGRYQSLAGVARAQIMCDQRWIGVYFLRNNLARDLSLHASMQLHIRSKGWLLV